jgi:predicted nucleic acid-binding Zn ribbon protein
VSPFRRSPRPLTLALDEIQSQLSPDTPLADAQAVWRAAVGEAIAEQAQPVSERSGILTVACSASVWAQELDLMAASIIERLNAALGGPGGEPDGAVQITRIRCVTTPPVWP